MADAREPGTDDQDNERDAIEDAAGQAVKRLLPEDQASYDPDLRLDLSLLLDLIDALVVVIDQQGQVLQFNLACERATGYSRQEIEGRAFCELLLPAEDAEQGMVTFEALRLANSPSGHLMRWPTKSGGRRTIDLSSTMVRDSSGKSTYVVLTGRDITPSG